MVTICGGWASHAVVYFSLLFNFRPLFVYCKIVLTVCLNLAWLLTLMTVGHALVIGAWRLVTAVWRAQRSFWWPGKVHSLCSVNRYAVAVTGCLHVPIVGPTGRSHWSVRLVGPTIVSCKRFVRPVGQTVGRIKHVWFRPTADPTVEACGHYVRLVGPTGQSDDQSRCSVGGIIIS